MANNIIWQEFNGLSDSLFSGIKNSFYKMVGIDRVSNPGSITVNQKLSKNSGSTVDSLCRVSVAVSDGSKIWFSYTSGDIFRESGGVWTKMYTTSPAAGNAGCLGAAEFNTYIYWATQSRLHRIAVADIATANWTGAVPNWQTFSKTDSEFHPMVVQNAALFIGDGNLMAKVDSSAAFSATGILNLVAPHRIRTIAPYDIDLVIGTVIAAGVNFSLIVRWDTVQTAWQYAEPVLENGVNAFLWTGTVLLVQAGTSGSWYYYDGVKLQPYKRIPGTWSPTSYGEVFPQAVGVLRNVPIFGFSNGSGNPADQGIYSIGSYSKDYPKVMSGPEFVISEDVVASISIGAIIVDGQNLYVSWQSGTSFGIDKLSYSAVYESSYLETLRITPDLINNSTTYRIAANYQSLPANTSLAFKYRANNDSSYTSMTVVDDTVNKRIYAELSIDCRAIQFRIEFTVSGNTAPVIEAILIEFAV